MREARDTEHFTKAEWEAFRRIAAGWLPVSDEQLKVQDALDRCWGGLTQEEADSIANYRGGYEWK